MDTSACSTVYLGIVCVRFIMLKGWDYFVPSGIGALHGVEDILPMRLIG
jgi:hypothetical protein